MAKKFGDLKNDVSEPDFDLDENLEHLGIWNWFPSGIFLFLCGFIFMSPMQMMSSHVSSSIPPHHCKLPSPNVSSTASESSILDYTVEDVIPKVVVGGVETFASCERFEIIDQDLTFGERCFGNYFARLQQ